MPPTSLVITMTIPIAFGARMQAALAANYRYQALVIDENGALVSNPQTVQEFILANRVQELKNHVAAYEVPDLAKDDRQDRIDEINAVSITSEITTV